MLIETAVQGDAVTVHQQILQSGHPLQPQRTLHSIRQIWIIENHIEAKGFCTQGNCLPNSTLKKKKKKGTFNLTTSEQNLLGWPSTRKEQEAKSVKALYALLGIESEKGDDIAIPEAIPFVIQGKPCHHTPATTAVIAQKTGRMLCVVISSSFDNLQVLQRDLQKTFIFI